MTKNEYIINFYRSNDHKWKKTDIKLDDNLFPEVVKRAKELNITVSEYCNMLLVKKMVEIQKEEERKKGLFKEYIDIFDFYKAEEILDNLEDDILVINPNGKHVVLMKPDKFEVINNLKFI